MKPSPSSDAPPPSNGGEPEVIRRLVAKGVEYTFVKMIVLGAPLDTLTTMLLHPSGASHPLARLFRTATYGTILAAIAADEARVSSLRLVSDAQQRSCLSELVHLRAFTYQSLIGEPALAKLDRSFVLRPILTGFDTGRRCRSAWRTAWSGTPATPWGGFRARPSTSMPLWTLRKRSRQLGQLLAARTVPSGDGYAEGFNRAVAHGSPGAAPRPRGGPCTARPRTHRHDAGLHEHPARAAQASGRVLRSKSGADVDRVRMCTRSAFEEQSDVPKTGDAKR